MTVKWEGNRCVGSDILLLSDKNSTLTGVGVGGGDV